MGGIALGGGGTGGIGSQAIFAWANYPSIEARLDHTALANMLTSAAASFDGTNWLEIDTAAVTGFDVTMVAWVKSGETAEQTALWIGNKDTADEWVRIGLDSAGDAMLGRIASGGAEDVTTGSNIDDDAWHFIGAVLDAADDAALYVDSDAAVTDSTSRAIANFDRTTVGATGDSSRSAHFKGEIDNPLIWTRALTAAQISWVQTNKPTYNTLSTSTDTNNPGTTGLVLANKLDEMSGVRMDQSGNALHLAPAGDAVGVTFERDDLEYAEVDTAAFTAYGFSMGCSFKSGNAASQALMAVCDKDSAAEAQWILINGTTVQASSSSAGDGTQSASDSTIDPDDGSWHTAAGVWTNATLRDVYADGNTSQDTVSVTIGATYDRTSLARIGVSTPSSRFDGTLDNAWIYSTALTAAQVGFLQSGGTGGLPATYQDVLQSNDANNPGTTGLVAWWKLNEDDPSAGGDTLVNVHNPGTLDLSSGSGGVGPVTATGHVTDLPFAVAGTIEQVAEVEDRATGTAVSGSKYLSRSGSFPLTTWPRSIAAWMKTAADENNARLIHIGDGSLDNRQEMYMITGGQMRAAVRFNAGSTSFLTTAGALNDNEWHLLVMCSTADNVHKLSIDGGAYASSGTDIGGVPLNGAQGIGNRVSGLNPLTTTVDEAMVFDGELTAADVTALWNGGAGVLGQDLVDGTVVLPSAITPFAAWPLSANNAAGQGYDATGSGYNLTVTGGPSDDAGIAAGQTLHGLCWQSTDQASSNDLTQATFAARPEVVGIDAGTREYALRGDGVNDYLQVDFGADNSEPHDTWIVCKLTAAASTEIFDGIAALKEHAVRTDATPNWQLDQGTPQVAGTPNTNWHVLHIQWAVAADKLFVDGGSAVISADAGSEDISGITLFADAGLTTFGDLLIAEVVQTTAAHTDAQRNQIGRYLAGRIGTTWTALA
jgi:hypothetical protein